MSSNNISDVFCPLCGAPAHFDIVHQNYKCSYCDGKVEIRDAIKEKEGFRELHQKKIKEDAKNYKLLSGSCNGCGATVVFEENEPMTTCAFCGKALVRKEYTSDEELPELIIPFRITEDEAKKIAREWCDSNKDKVEAKHFSERISDIKGFYLPYELIRGSVSCDAGRKDNNSRYTCRGNVAQEFINRSKQLDNLLLDAMEPFELSDLKEFDFAYLAGQRVKVSDIDNDELNKRICCELEENYKPELKKTFKTEALDVSVFTESILRMPVLLPVYYICDGNFMAVINGQTGKVSVRAEKDSYYYFLPWWIKAILSTVIICTIVYLLMIVLGMEKEGAIYASSMLAVVIGIVSLCVFAQDSKMNAFREFAGRKIFSSKGGPYRRTEMGLVKDQAELKREMIPPVFFYKILDEEKPVEFVFTSFSRLFPMYFTGFVILFLPVILALFLNGFNFQKLTLSGSAVWFCIFVPVVPIYLLKFAYVTLYNSPWIYQINEDGSKKRYQTEDVSTLETIKSVGKTLFEEPGMGCFFVGFLLFIFVMNTYITAFGYGDDDKKDNASKKQVVTEAVTNKGSEKISDETSNSKTNLNKKTENVENSDSKNISKDKTKIELSPLKQNNISVYFWNTKEFFRFSTGKDNGYYTSMHFIPENKIDWYIFSLSVNEKCRLYLCGKMGEKGSEKLVYITVNESGFDVTDLEKKLLWSVEVKDNEYLLKKGSDRKIAYKFSKFKQKTSTVLDSYMMLDVNDEIKSVSWKTENGLYVVNENKETKFYIPKSNLNSKNEPALAFPNIYMIEEMNYKLRNVIAIEMSQLE